MAGLYYAVQQMGREADIWIFGDITRYPMDDSDMSAGRLVDKIAELEADTLNVHIDSYGGSVSEGWAIYNALRQFRGRVTTYGDGFVASAALYPFLAGEERFASTLSAYYLHEVMTWGDGYADDLRKAADEADRLTEIGVKAFVERTGMTEDEVRALMQAETWLTPEEAMARGIATAIKEDAMQQRTQSAKRQIMQKMRDAPEKGEEPRRQKGKEQPSSGIMGTLAGIFKENSGGKHESERH